MHIRCASFNTLADAYIRHGDYSHVEPELLEPRARIVGTLSLIDKLQVDLVGIQEAEQPLVDAIGKFREWQMFWSPKKGAQSDGCLTLARPGIDIKDFRTHVYADSSGHIAQIFHIGQAVFADTHLKWAAKDNPNHAGTKQAAELLKELSVADQAVILTDCNDRPGGPVRRLTEQAGYSNVTGDTPTAFVNQAPVVLDLIAVRGIVGQHIETGISPLRIPDRICSSDHLPVVASLYLP